MKLFSYEAYSNQRQGTNTKRIKYITIRHITGNSNRKRETILPFEIRTRGYKAFSCSSQVSMKFILS